jgi:hypothetical protein
MLKDTNIHFSTQLAMMKITLVALIHTFLLLAVCQGQIFPLGRKCKKFDLEFNNGQETWGIQTYVLPKCRANKKNPTHRAVGSKTDPKVNKCWPVNPPARSVRMAAKPRCVIIAYAQDKCQWDKEPYHSTDNSKPELFGILQLKRVTVNDLGTNRAKWIRSWKVVCSKWDPWDLYPA